MKQKRNFDATFFLHPKSAALPFSVVVMERSFLHSITLLIKDLISFVFPSLYLNFAFHGIDALRISSNRLNLQIRKHKSKTNKKDEWGKYFRFLCFLLFPRWFYGFCFLFGGAFCGKKWTYLIQWIYEKVNELV